MNKDEYVNVDALGTAKFLIHVGKRNEANKVLDMIYPYCSTIEQLDAIGYVYTKNRNFKMGLTIALRLLPKSRNQKEMWDSRVNVIRSYLNSNLPNEALKYIKANKVINPLDQPNLMDEAYALFLLNRKDEGEVILREILKNPSSEDVYNRCLFNLGSYDLRNGNFKEGIKNFLLNGRKMEIWKSLELKNNRSWCGQIIPGATIVQIAEGGIGDELINIRFQKHISNLGMNPVWYTDRKDLAEIFTRCGYNVITNISDIPKDWFWCYSMLVPCYLDIDEDKLWDGPYLSSSSKFIKGTKKKIGIKVSGNPEYDQDLARSIPLEKLVDVIPEEYELYSFHKDEILEHHRVINWMDKDVTWEQTLNKIQEMDLIISSCTSLVHAAGAIGKDAVVLVPILKYYLWANDKESSPWYGNNLTVLHQEVPNSWDICFDKLKTIL